ncbi:MAG: hypothetical protein LBT11_04555 [Treponema sp.]|jgi:hypothetical protein|nr:hypothetical protein [Treponema sp.]
MADTNELLDYRNKLKELLDLKREMLEKTELPQLREEFRAFHNSFNSLYKLLLKRGLIDMDPYKAEARISKIEVPDASSFPDTEKADQLSIRLAQFDNQLDFLVNFYQFNLDQLTLDQIQQMLGLVQYIDWVHFIPDIKAGCMTMFTAEIVNQSRGMVDQFSLSIITEALSCLQKSSATILRILNHLSDYSREAWKEDLREQVLSDMFRQESSLVKKLFAVNMPGRPFFQNLADEVLREADSIGGEALRTQALKRLEQAMAEDQPKDHTPKVVFKTLLIEGLHAIGGVYFSLTEIAPKLDENAAILEERKKSFWERVREFFRRLLNKPPEPVVYEVEYMDANRGIKVQEKINFTEFRSGFESRIASLQNVSSSGAAAARFADAEEDVLVGILERNIQEVQSIHKILSILDEYFKAAAPKESRSKVRGIKPELAVVKNGLVRANQRRYEYSSRTEEAE